MKRHNRRASGRIAALMLAILIFLSIPASAFADAGISVSEVTALRDETSRYVYESTPQPGYETMEGRWEVYSLKNSGVEVPQSWYDAFYSSVESWVKEKEGVLHRRKYTEYSAMVIVLTTLGYDPSSVAGYDLTAALSDFDSIVWQGVNGPSWALQALECLGADNAARQPYIDEILARQLDCGGWNLNDRGGGGEGDIDLTGMTLQALAADMDQPAVKNAADRAVAWLSSVQAETGGFIFYGTETCESDAMILLAMARLGIAVNDPRFIKNGHTVLDALLSYRQNDGSFLHVKDMGADRLATEQALRAMNAAISSGILEKDAQPVKTETLHETLASWIRSLALKAAQ